MQPNNSEQKNIISGTSVNQPVTKASTSGGPLTGYQVPKPTKRVYGTVGSEQPLDDTSPALKEAPLITPAPAVALPYRKMALWSGLALAVVFVIGTAAVFLNTKAGHKNLANSSDKIATTTDDPLQSALDNSLIKINRNTTINSKTLTATGDVLVQNESVSGFDVMNQAGDKLLSVDTKNNQVKIAAAPGSQVALQASGNILASGSLQASNSGSSLSNQGLVINSVLVCTAAGCNSKTSQSLPDLSVYAKQSDLLSYAKLSSSQTFTGVNTFQGKVGVGAVPSAGGAQLQVSGNVDVTGNFSVNGTSGTSLTCPASQLLQQPVIIGGIITSGVCVPGAGASVATLQESYDASIPASVVLSSASGPLQLQDGTTPLGTDLFEVTSNGGGTKYFSVSATGTKVNGSDVCTTAGNCSGVGGGVTTAGGTTNQLTKFTGSQSIGDSIISDNGTTVTVGGTLNATVVQQNGIGVLTTNTNFAGDISGTYNSTVIGVGAVNSSKILDGTITDADISGTAGIAYSKLNLTGNIVNGDISAVASISYSKLNLNGSVTNNDIAGGAAIAYGKLALNNSIVNADISSSAAITDDKLAQISSAGKVADTALSANVTKQGNTFNGANQLVQTDASSHISNTNLNSDVALTDRAGGQTFTTAQTFNSSITAPGITAGGAALGIGASGDTLNLNGNYNSSLAVTDGAHTTTVGFSGTPTANVTYDFDVAAATGAYTICTTAGNCTGVSGGAVGGSGTAGKIAKFTGSGFTVGDSILSDNGTTVSVGGTLNATTLQQAGTGVLLQTTAFSGDVSGAYSATSVDKLKGTSLSISSLADTDFLIYNSTSGNWENHSISGDLTVDNSGAASIGTGKVTSLQIADGTITNTDISTSAGITDDKLAQISSAGKVADSALSANVTKQGNTFNGNNELVQTDGSGKIGDGLLSTNVALHNANNTFTGNNVFSLNTAGLAVQDAATPLGTNLFEIDNNDGTTKYFTVSATALQFLGNDVCTASGNCAGTSSGIGGSGTGGKIAKFTGSGTSYTVGDSLISDNGTTVTVGGTLAVNTITPTATLTVGTPTQTLSLQGDGSTSLSATSGSSTNSIVFVAPTGNHTINVPDAAGTIAVSASGPLSLDAAGNLTCPTCLTSGGGGTAGVSSVNSLTGAITLAGTTNEITITPSSNTLTFSLPQTIDTGSTPDFAGIKIGGSAISSSDLSDSASITLQGNTFNGNNELVQTDGSGHISNTNLNSDVALTDRAGGQTFTTDQLIKETSATAFQVQDSSTNSILVADSTNNRIIINNLSFGGTGNISQTITKSMVVTSAVNAHDVVIIDSANPGQVTTTSTPNSNLIYGVATATKAAGQTQDIVIGGTYQVNVDATSTIAVGDFIATSGTTGEVTTNNNPAAGTILGRALSAITVPGAGQTVWVQVTPDVGGGSAGTGVTSLGSYTHCTAYADGAQISGTTLTLGCADATHPGLIDTQAQTFAGDKTFSGTVNANLLQQGGEGVVLQNTAFSGDVSGPYNSTSVDKLKGTSLSINTLADTDFLIYNSTSGNWENHSVGGDIAIDHTGAATIQTGAVDSSKIADGTITNTDISGSAAIAYSKLNLGSSIAQSDLSSSLSNSLAYLAGNQTFSGTNSFQNSSATAFQVQSASAAETLLTVDTTARSASGGNLVKIGNSTGTDADTTILVLDGASAAPSTDLSVLSGGLFYNTNTNHIDVIENGAVKELCNKTDLGCGSAGPVTTLNGAYINGSSAADQTINLTSGDGGGVVIKDQAGGLGSTLFGVQDSTGGTKYLDISAAGSILTGQLTFKNTSDGQTISVNQGRAGGQGIIFSNNAGNEVSYIHMLSSSDNSLAFCANNNTSSCPLGQEQFILNSQNGGAAKFRNSANSISGFQVQNASGSNLFNIDTTNGIVGTIATSVASTNSNSLTLQTGNATGTTSNSGNVSIDVGTATGTTGTISIGTANASAISIGKTGLTTVNNGSLTVAQNLTANNLLSSVADGASAVGFTLNTSNTLATTGSKLLSLQNNGSEKLSVDKGGNLSAAGVSATGTVSGSALSSNSSLTFSNSAQGFIQQSMTSGGVIGIKHVVVLNSSNQVVETTTPRDVNIYGVANGNASGSGQAINIITYGTADVAVDTATVNIGDQLVASSTGGLATVDDSATTGIIGIARTFKAGGATGSVTAQISPVRGVYTPHFIPGSDSATAFQIQSALAADTLFTADTTARSASGGNLVKIGNSTGTDADTTILVVDSASSAPTSDLGALNGGLFYNSTTNHLNVIENGQVKELCNKTDLGCGTAAPATTLAGSYANGSSQTDEMIALDSTRNGVLIRDNATPIGGGTGTLFGVQDSTGGTKYLDVTTSGIAVTGTIKASNTSNASLITVNSSHAGSRGIDFYNSSDGSLSYIHNNNASPVSGLSFCLNSTNSSCARDQIIFGQGGTASFRNSTDSSTAFQIQNASGAQLLNVDTTASANLITNGGFESGATGWTVKNGSTLTQVTTQQWQGNGSLQIAAGASANSGASYAYTLSPATSYALSLYARAASGTITDLVIGRQDVSGTDINCATSATLTTSWQRLTCTFTTGATITSSNIYVQTTGTGSESFYIDGVQLQTGSTTSAFNAGGALQFDGIINSPLAIQNKSDSANAFQVQSAAGTNILNVDSTGQSVSIGQPALYTTASGGIFSAKSDYTTDANPNSVTTADFNGDGKSDLATVNATGTVSILLGNGDGTFQAKTSFSLGAVTTRVLTSADVNNDGKVDLLVSNDTASVVDVLLGNGDGTFQAAVGYPDNINDYSITTADFNKDGYLDVLTAHYGASAVCVLLNNGNGTFGTKTCYSTGSFADFATTGDLNNDGYADIISGDHTGNLSTFLNNGNGTFGTRKDVTSSGDIDSIAVGDFNGDGKLDAAAANTIPGTVGVRLGNGDGTFQAATNYTVGSSPKSIVAGDFNSDGKLDLVVANSGGSSLSLLLGNGDGTFQAQQTLTTGSAPYFVTTGNFNGDSFPDLAATNNGSSSVSVFLGNVEKITHAGLSVSTTTAQQAGLIIQGVSSQQADLLRVQNVSGNPVFDVSGSGAALFQNATDSTTAFQIQNAAGSNLLTADTSNSQLTLSANTNIGSSYGNTVFSDDFESGTILLWGRSGSIGSTPETSVVHNGRYAMAFAPTGGSSSNLTANASNAGGAYLRAWVYVASQSTANLMVMGLDNGSGNGYQWNVLRSSTGQLCINNTGASSTNCSVSTNFTTGAWHLVELQITSNTTTTGVTNLWLDGANVYSSTTDNNGNATSVSNVIAGDRLTGDIGSGYIDDIVVSTVRSSVASSLNVQDSLSVDGNTFLSGHLLLKGSGLQFVDTSNNNKFSVTAGTGNGTNKYGLTSINTSGTVIGPPDDNTTVFQIQNASGASLFNADTSNTAITVFSGSTGNTSAWNTTTALPSSTSLGASVVVNGYLYWIGGMNASNTAPVQTIYYAKLNTDGTVNGTWQTINTAGANQLPVALYGINAFVSNGYIYVLGGINSSGVRQTTVYSSKVNADGTLSAWQTLNSLPVAYGGSGVTVSNGNVYTLGGDDGSSTYGTVYYAKLLPDGTLGSWKQNGVSLPSARTGLSAATANGFIYALGGKDTVVGGPQNNVWYGKINNDGSISSWSTSANTLSARQYFGSYVAGNYIYVAGGINGSDLNSVYYAPLTLSGDVGAWTQSTNNMSGRDSFGFTVANGYILYALAGAAGVTNTVQYTYTPRIQAYGSIDLVGSGNPTGGSLTAGNTNVKGYLQVTGSTVLGDSLQVAGDLTTTGNSLFKSAANSTAAFQVQNSTSATLLNVDTLNRQVGLNADTSVGTLYGNRLFSDNFESGNHKLWSTISGAPSTTQSAVVHSGQYAEQFSPGSGTAYYLQNNVTGGTTIYLRSYVYVASQAAGSTVTVMGTDNGSGNGYEWDVQRNDSTGQACVLNTHTSTSLCVNGFTTGAWHELELQVVQAGVGSSTTQLWLDGTPVSSTTEDNGTGANSIVRIFTGTRSGTITANYYIDDVTADRVRNSVSASLNVQDTLHVGGSSTFGGPLLVSNDSATAFRVNGSFANVLTVGAQNVGSLQNGQITINATQTTITPYNDTTAAFQVQNSTGGSLLNVDSQNSNITLNGLNSPTLEAWQTNTMPCSINGPGTLTLNGYLYVIGGWTNAGGACQPNASGVKAEVYYSKLAANGAPGSWQTTTSIPDSAGREDAPVVTANGYIYILGGSDGTSNQTTVYYTTPKVDGTLNSWKTTTALPAAITSGNVVTNNGYIYLIGGTIDGSHAVQTTYHAKLNPDGTIGSWVPDTGLPANTGNLFAGVVKANGYVYLVGGKDETNSSTNTVRYAQFNADGSLGVWNSTTVLPGTNNGGVALAANGYLYAISGSSFGVATYHASLNASGTIGAWTADTSLPGARPSAGIAQANGYTYVIGGGPGSYNTVYYSSTSRVQISGSLDLLGGGGGSLAANNGSGNLTAGNTRIVGTLNVSDASVLQGPVAVGSDLSVGGTASFHSSSNSTAAFQVQNSSGTSLLTGDTVNMALDSGGDVNIGTTYGHRLFADGFESGNIALWDSNITPAPIQQAIVHSGKYSGAFSLNGSGSSYIGSKLNSGAVLSTVYQRGWVYITSQTGNANFMGMTNGGNGNAWSLRRQSADGQVCLMNNGVSIACGGNLTLNAWHSVQLMTTIGAGTGSNGVWLDGSQIINQTSQANGTVGVQVIYFGDQSGGDTISGYVDDVSVDTNYVSPTDTSLSVDNNLVVGGASSLGQTIVQGNTKNTFLVQNSNGNTYFKVDAYDLSTTLSGVNNFVKPVSDSTTAFQIQNAAGTNNLLTADTTNTAININGNTSIGSALRGDIQFSDGFESGNGSFWSGTSDGVSSVQSAVVHSGRYAYEFNNSGGSASTWTVKMNQNTIYARAWVYVASQTSATAEVFGLTNGGNGNSWIVQRTTGGQVCVNSANCGGSFTAGAWHEIELQVTIGAGTGVTNLWLDGTQIVNLSSQANGTVGVQNLEIGDHSASHTITGYLDDITASTMRNSTSNALNVSDFLSVQGNSAFNGQVVIRPNQQIGSIFNVVTNSGTSLLNLGNNNGTETASIHAVNTTIQSTTNSTAAFQIQNAAGTNNLLTADTVNNAINVSSDLNVGTNYGKTLMADDFESGTTSLWDPYVAGIGPVIVSATTPAPVYHGKYAVKFAPSSSPSYLTHSYGAHGDNTTSASLRAWVYVPAGGQSSTYLDLMETAYNYFNTYWTVQRDTSGHLCIDSVVSGGYNGEDCSASTSFTTDAWHEVELTVTTGASTGSAQAWLDGASVVSLSGKNYTSNNLGYIIAGSLQNANIGTYYEDTITAYEDSNEHPVSHSINVDENLHVSGSAVMGETIISPAYSSTQAFQVLNSSNASLFTVDTVNYAVNTYASALFKNQGNSTAAFQVQNAGGSQILGIDTTIDAANLITNGSFETNTSGWAAKNGSGTSTLSQVTSGTTAPYIGAGSMQIATSGADSTNAGASYSRNFVNSTQYTLSLFVKASGSPITTLQIGRSNDNTTDTSCLSLAAIPTTGWTKVSCTFTYTGTTGTSYVYIKQTDSANHTWFIDGVKLEAAASATPYKEGGISLTGNITSAVTIQNQADSTNAFQVQTSGGSSVLNVDTLNRQVVYNTTLGGTVTLGSPSALPGIVFANSDGTGRSQIRQTSTGGGLSFGATSGNGIPANQFTLSNTGTALFQNSTNSTAAFQVQNAAGASLINVDTTATVNLITNGAFESMATTGWTVKNGSTLAQVTTQQWQGNNSMQIVGSASNNTGASYAYTLSPSTQYSLSFYAKVASGSISDLAYGRQDIAGTDSNCSSANAVSTKWTKYTCTFTTGATITSSNIYVQTTGTGSETFFIDGVQLQTGSTATAFNAGGALQFGGIINSPVAIQNTSNSGNAFQVENAAGINVLNVDTQNSAVTVKTGFYVQSSTGTNNFSVNATNGRVSIGSVTPNAALEIRPFNSDANIQLDRADTGGSVSTFSASSTGLTVATTGSTIFKPTTGNDSTTAFQIQSSGGSALLNADTLGGKITINQIGAYSDDFNSGGPTAGSQWSFVTSDSSTYSVNSALAGDLRIIPATPTTAYDCWTTQCNDPRLTETAPTGNFQADVKLDTLPPVTANSTAGQGLMLYKDSSDFIRFEIQATGVANTWKVAAHKVISGVGTDNIITSPNLISLTAPIYLRVTRSLDTWTLYYSTNGTTFTSAGSFTQSLDLSSAGSVLALYMGNSTTGTMPSFPNADFDYLHVYTGSATVLQVAGAANFQNAYDSTTAFQVQNSSGRDLLSVDTTNSAVSVGNTTDGSQISLAASGNANATITKNMPVTGTVNAHDLVVIDNLNDGHVTTTTTANDPKVFGIATGSGTPQDIVIGGTYQVNLISTNQAIVPGDYLVSTTTAGQVDKATGVPPSGTAIGQALQTVAANTGGTIWVYVTPGEGGTGVGGSTTLQQAYDYSTTSPQITLDNSPGAGGLIVQDNSTPLIGSLFTVQGNGCASATCKYLDVSASGVAIAGSLSVSSTITSTGVITANGGISVAANQTISMAGGATGSRPASPTKGTLYYDTSTNQLVQYNGTKWQAPSKNNTEIVAPSAWTGATAAQLKAEQDAADFVATGTDDGTTINSALSALPATGGGTVYLLPGTYTLGTTSISVPNNTTLTGSGDSTILTYPNSFGSGSTNYYAIKNSDTSTGTNVTVKDLLIDGNGSTQTAGLFFGVYFNGMGASTTRTGGRITDITTQNLFGNSIAGIILNNSFNNILTGDTSSNNFFGIYLQNSSNNTLNGNIAQGGDYGIVASSSNNNVLTSNTTQNNSSFGIELTSSSNNTLTGNIAQGNSASGIDLFSSSNNNTLTANTAQGNFSFGLYFNSSNNNTITGNTTQGNGTSGIYLYSASDNNISSNKLHDNGGSTANNALYLSNSSTKNSITSNDITDNAVANSSCTTTCYAINISDAGSTANYISANHILGDGTHAASIANPNNDTETFANQPLTENGDASFRNATDSAAAFQVQKASGTTLMNIDTSGNNIAVGITGSTNANSTIHLADSSAGVQTVTIGSTNSTSSTTLQGGTGAGAISLQAASTGTILIGTNNANTITLGGNTTLAAGKTLTVTGGTTGSRPASPTKGTLFYDTSTNNLIQYNGTKWVSAPKSNTFIVAASNSTQAEKDAADYVAPGTGDQATINNIFTNLAPCNTTGCSVYLMEGTYYLSAAISVPDNSTLEGSGASTIITVPNAQNGSYNMIQNTDTTTGTNVTIQNLLIDGNKANQTSGTMEGIYFNAMGAGSGSGARNGGNITNVITKNIYSGTGIYLSSSNNNTVTGNSALGNDNYGIYLSSSNNNTVTGNSAQGNGGPGIFLDSSSNNNLSGNTAQGNGDGIYLSSSNNNTVTGNTPQGNSFYGVYLNSSSDNNLSGNKLHDNGGSTDNNGIYLDASSTKNSITGNDITDTGCTTTCYAINISDVGSTGNYLTSNHFLGDGTHAASINDATSGGNTYSNQPLTENGDASFRNGTNSTTAFQIQNASGASLFTVDTTNNTITLGAASANPVLLVLGNKNTSGDPTCTSGAIYYNSNTNRFRACTNGTWATFGAYAPGYELGYAQTTSNTTITATTEAGATTILTSPAVTYDGNTVVQIQVYIPEINDATSLGVGLWLDGTEQFGKLQPLDASGSGVYNLSLRLTPSSGSHTYTVRAWSSAGTGTAFAGSGSGGASSYPPAYIRISVAN